MLSVAAKDSAECFVSSAKSKAEREAMGTGKVFFLRKVDWSLIHNMYISVVTATFNFDDGGRERIPPEKNEAACEPS